MHTLKLSRARRGLLTAAAVLAVAIPLLAASSTASAAPAATTNTVHVAQPAGAVHAAAAISELCIGWATAPIKAWNVNHYEIHGVANIQCSPTPRRAIVYAAIQFSKDNVSDFVTQNIVSENFTPGPFQIPQEFRLPINHACTGNNPWEYRTGEASEVLNISPGAGWRWLVPTWTFSAPIAVTC